MLVKFEITENEIHSKIMKNIVGNIIVSSLSVLYKSYWYKTINNNIWLNILTTENGPVLRYAYYMVHTGFIGLYVTVRTFAQ